MKNFISIIIILITILSCNLKEDNANLEREGNTNILSEYENLNNNLVNKPKLFLKFWHNMSKKEFDTVVKILVNDKILEQENYSTINYLTSECKSRLNSIFVNDSLKQIELLDGVCLYKVYKEKYNLPDLLEKNLVDRKSIEKNLDYDPSMFYYSDKGTVYLPDCFIDKSTFSTNDQKNLVIDENGLKEKILSKTPIIIEKDNSVIFLEQSFYKSPMPITTYSLDLNPEMEKYKMEHPLMAFTPEGKYIHKNSKFKIIETVSSSIIKIIYKSNSDYQNELQRKKTLDKEIKIEKEKMKNRDKSVKDEI